MVMHRRPAVRYPQRESWPESGRCGTEHRLERNSGLRGRPFKSGRRRSGKPGLNTEEFPRTSLSNQQPDQYVCWETGVRRVFWGARPRLRHRQMHYLDSPSVHASVAVMLSRPSSPSQCARWVSRWIAQRGPIEHPGHGPWYFRVPAITNRIKRAARLNRQRPPVAGAAPSYAMLCRSVLSGLSRAIISVDLSAVELSR